MGGFHLSLGYTEMAEGSSCTERWPSLERDSQTL
jgi:hypothetical protein